MPARKRLLIVRSVWALVWMASTAFFGWVFHFRYWIYRHDFNDLGRYWDGEEVHTDSAFVWSLLVAGFGLALCVSLFRTWRRLRALNRRGGEA